MLLEFASEDILNLTNRDQHRGCHIDFEIVQGFRVAGNVLVRRRGRIVSRYWKIRVIHAKAHARENVAVQFQDRPRLRAVNATSIGMAMAYAEYPSEPTGWAQSFTSE